MLKKVKAFFHSFLNSLIPQSEYYRKIVRSPFSSSLSYFLVIVFILNLSFVASLIVKYSPIKINVVMTEVINSLNNYPDGLTINIHKGRLITNNNRPYLFWVNHQNKENLILVVDESASPQKIQQYKSYFLFTPQYFVFNNLKNNSVFSVPLSYFDDYKITKQTVTSLVKSISLFQNILPLISIAVLLILIIFLPMASLLVMFTYIVISSFVVFLLFKLLTRKHFHFKKILQVSFHAATLPLLLDYGVIIFRPSITVQSDVLVKMKQLPFSCWFFILLAVFVAVGVYEAYEEEKKSHADSHETHLHQHTHSHKV